MLDRKENRGPLGSNQTSALAFRTSLILNLELAATCPACKPISQLNRTGRELDRIRYLYSPADLSYLLDNQVTIKSWRCELCLHAVKGRRRGSSCQMLLPTNLLLLAYMQYSGEPKEPYITRDTRYENHPTYYLPNSYLGPS